MCRQFVCNSKLCIYLILIRLLQCVDDVYGVTSKSYIHIRKGKSVFKNTFFLPRICRYMIHINSVYTVYTYL